ncbi:carboxypeptidase-like regulatory domain-containing protein [Flectobacillus roseus]
MPLLKPLLLVFLLSLTFHPSLAQNIVKIQVNNAQKTNEPIVGATVQIIGRKYFTLSNEEGFFELDQAIIHKKDSLQITCIGFQSRTIAIADMLHNPHVYLRELVTELEEVKVHGSETFNIIIGNVDKKGGNSLNLSFGDKVALFIPNLGIEHGYISKFRYFAKAVFGLEDHFTEPFLIQLYSVDSIHGKPHKPLLKEALLLRASKSNKWNEFDLSQYGIQIPSNGIFVSIGLLTQEEYNYQERYISTYSVLEKRRVSIKKVISPKVSFSKNVYKNLHNWIWRHNSSKWSEFPSSLGTFMLGLEVQVYE